MILSGLSMDLRQALRQLLRAPAWSAAIVTVLALGLGLALATFMLIDALLFRPLGIVEQQRVVKIASSREHLNSSSYPAYLEFRDRNDVFSGVVASGGARPMHWRQPDGSRLRVSPGLVSGNFFEALGVVPQLGRALAEDDDRPGAERVAVLSDAFWRSRLSARADVIGTTLLLDDWPVLVVGVMPKGFQGFQTGGGPALWIPLATGSSNPALMAAWNWHWLDLFARLKPGISVSEADAQVDAIARARDRDKIEGTMEQRAQAVPVFPLASSMGDAGVGRSARLLLGGALLILLTACANATGLLLVRGERRRGELALRASIGAGNWRLARLVLIESVMLALIGAGCGLLLGQGLAQAALDIGAAESVLYASPDTLPELIRSSGAALLLALAVALISALVPALRPRRMALVEQLKAGGSSGGGRRWRLGRVLVGAQFALTLVLVIGAGLMLRSFLGIVSAPIGTAAFDVRVMQLDFKADGLDNAERISAETDAFLDATRGAPGIAAVGTAAMMPISDSSWESNVTLPERTDGRTDPIQVYYNPISSGFFAALEMPMSAGRDFGAGDVKGAPPVVIVSQAFARKYFPGVDPIGRHLDDAEIVGVASDLKLTTVTGAWPDVVYAPYAQRRFGSMFMVVARAEPGADAALLATLARAWRRIEPDRAVPHIETLRERISGAVATPRFLAATLAVFAALALVLAAAGIYGAFAFWISVRRRELGLRLALGAETSEIFALVLRDGLRVIAVGSAVGILAALALGRLVSSQLVGLSPYDVPTYVGVLLLVGTVGLLATALPARNAARIDPQESLRCE